MICPSLSLGKYDNLGTRVVNIVCHGHKCNILYISLLQPKEAVWEVRVIDHVSDVTLKCQNGFATFQEGECQLVIYRGSGLKVTDTVDEQSRERNTLGKHLKICTMSRWITSEHLHHV